MKRHKCMPHLVGAFIRGVGIADMVIDSSGHLLIHLENGEVIDAGQLPDTSADLSVFKKQVESNTKSISDLILRVEGINKRMGVAVVGESLATEE